MLLNRFKRTLSFLFIIALIICPLSACQKKVDPLAKSGFSALTLDKKNRIHAEITLDSQDLQEHAGQSIFLYELSPDEELPDLSTKDPLDGARISHSVTLSTNLTDGDRSRLYSRFYAVFSDGSLLSTDGFWIENPQQLAANKSEFPWGNSQKGISIADANLAVELGSMHMMLDTSSATLTENATEVFSYNGVEYPISHNALALLDKQMLDAAQAGMQVSLMLTLDANTSRGQAVALIDLLTSRYSTESMGIVTALFLDTPTTANLSDVALLCRVSNLALRSRIASARVYVLSSFESITETKAFFSNLSLNLALGGTLEWGAAITPVVSEEPWEKDTSDLMAINRLGELSRFLFYESNNTRAAWFAVCGLTFPSGDADKQAAAFAYAYRESVAAAATLIYLDVNDVESELYDEEHQARRIVSIYTRIDVALLQDDELLCKSIIGEAWSKKIADLDSRKLLSGIAGVGSIGFEETPLFEFHESEPHSFSAINGTSPSVLNSSAWNAPVLSTWIDPQASIGGVRTKLQDNSALEGVISLSSWILTTQAAEASVCTVRLTLEGETHTRQRLSYSADVEVAHAQWQLVTFQIADFVAEADLSRPIYLTLTTNPDVTPTEDYVFYVKDIYVRAPQSNGGTLLPALMIVACVVLSTVGVLLIYKRSARKRI